MSHRGGSSLCSDSFSRVWSSIRKYRTGVTGMREPIWHERHLVGFGNRLKDRDGVKGKVAESLAVKGRTVAEAMQLLPDAIRYTFQYCEARSEEHTSELQSRQ